MDSSKKNGIITKNTQFRFKESEGQKPDYSFDRWIQQAKEFGDDVNKMVSRGQEEEKDLDQKDKQEKEKIDRDQKLTPKSKPGEPKKKNDTTPEKNDDQEKESVWNTLKQVHKERIDALEKNKSDSGSKKPSSPPSST